LCRSRPLNALIPESLSDFLKSLLMTPVLRFAILESSPMVYDAVGVLTPIDCDHVTDLARSVPLRLAREFVLILGNEILWLIDKNGYGCPALVLYRDEPLSQDLYRPIERNHPVE
jgi:hypothetical protein